MIGQLRRRPPPPKKTRLRRASFRSGVRVRTTCACTLNASKRTSRWTVVLQKTGRRRTALYSEIKWQTVIVRWLSLRFMKMIEMTTNQKTNWRWRANQKTNKTLRVGKRPGGNLVLTWLRTYVLRPEYDFILLNNKIYTFVRKYII